MARKKFDLAKLDEVVERSKRRLEKSCKERVSAIEQFVGSHYGDGGSDKVVPSNLLEMATTIYLRLLAARSPKCMVSTDEPSLKPFAADMEIVLNQIPEEIRLGDTIRRAVMEAMFSIGVVKVGIAGIDPRPNFGDEPFVSLVQMDDYIVDMSARNWDEVQYEGNEYWLSVGEVKEAYGVELAGDEYTGDSVEGVKQARAITNDETGCEWEERVLLRDIYLVKENRMITYAVESKQLIRDIPWDGPEGTPYIKLWFTDVPGNLLPLAPIAVWRDLHDLSNTLYRKIANQSVAKKRVVVFQGGNDEDVRRFNEAEDGDAITYNGAQPREIEVGGMDQTALALFLQNNELMSRFAGNLDSLGGLSPSSSTASQDKLINESASARIAAMSDRTVDFAKQIFKRLGWYLWTDPVRERRYVKVLCEKYNISTNKVWTPETRDGDFFDYNFDVSVFSMQDDSPSTRMQKLNEVMQSFILPLQDMMMQQGLSVDARKLVKYVAKNSNMPELNEMIVDMQNPQGEQNPPKASVAFPQPAYVPHRGSYSHRVYERVNRPGNMTSQGKTAVMSAILLGGKVQPKEMAGATGENMM